MPSAKMPTEGRRESPRRLLLLLALALVVGGLLTWDRWGDGSLEAPQAAPGAAVVATLGKGKPSGGDLAVPAVTGVETSASHPLAHLALDELGDTVRRPLFEKTRRPVEPAKAAPSVPVPKRQADPHSLTLQGIILNEGHSAIALMRRTQTGQSVRLQEGDAVDGWTVERIEAERVHLVQGDSRIALQLFRKR
jgi:hypothetical protein